MLPIQTAAAFNEWMRRYIEEPERFRREIQTVSQFLADKLNGVAPSYGAACAHYLEELLGELNAQEGAATSDVAEAADIPPSEMRV